MRLEKWIFCVRFSIETQRPLSIRLKLCPNLNRIPCDVYICSLVRSVRQRERRTVRDSVNWKGIKVYRKRFSTEGNVAFIQRRFSFATQNKRFFLFERKRQERCEQSDRAKGSKERNNEANSKQRKRIKYNMERCRFFCFRFDNYALWAWASGRETHLKGKRQKSRESVFETISANWFIFAFSTSID